jgi:hypothetical protein
MPVCVVVVSNQKAAEGLSQQLKETKLPLTTCITLPPEGNAIDQVELLSPNLTRARRQKAMGALVDALWIFSGSHVHADHQPHHVCKLRAMG